MKIRDLSAVVQLTLGDAALVGGYVASDFQRGSQGRTRVVASSVRVNYDFEVASSRAGRNLSLTVFVEGSSPADARSKVAALLVEVESGPWLLDVYGDGTSEVWLCDPAEYDPTEFPGGTQWQLALSIPARPAY